MKGVSGWYVWIKNKFLWNKWQVAKSQAGNSFKRKVS